MSVRPVAVIKGNIPALLLAVGDAIEIGLQMIFGFDHIWGHTTLL